MIYRSHTFTALLLSFGGCDEVVITKQKLADGPPNQKTGENDQQDQSEPPTTAERSDNAFQKDKTNPY